MRLRVALAPTRDERIDSGPLGGAVFAALYERRPAALRVRCPRRRAGANGTGEMTQDSADRPRDQSPADPRKRLASPLTLLALYRVRRHRKAFHGRRRIPSARVSKVNRVHEDAVARHHRHTERERIRVCAGLPHVDLERLRRRRLVVCLSVPGPHDPPFRLEEELQATRLLSLARAAIALGQTQRKR